MQRKANGGRFRLSSFPAATGLYAQRSPCLSPVRAADAKIYLTVFAR